MKEKTADALSRLFELIRTLRAPGGCPWDREQRFEDVLSDLIEEAYELQWAAEQGTNENVHDEMGDVLFLVCFALVIRNESIESFSLESVARAAWEKIYRRHPHVFGDEEAQTSAESIAHWERIKASERTSHAPNQGALDGIPGNLPSLRRAEKIQERAAATGFDWNDVRDVVAKLREEVDELARAVDASNRRDIHDELGDVFFSAVNVARFLKIDPESALNGTNARFSARFTAMEAMIAGDSKQIGGLSLDEMDVYWERVKKDRRKRNDTE